MGLSRLELMQYLAAWGEPSFRAQQIMRWIYKEGIVDWNAMTDLSLRLRARLAAQCVLTPPPVLHMQSTPDGTEKWLLEVTGGGAIEAVCIPEPGRVTLCVSSQVGCALQCRFCHTAQQGFQRNLTAAEIIGQLWQVAQHRKQSSSSPITNIVFMGMGEPLLNLESVIPALRIMLDDWAYGLSKRRVTVSTSGVVPGIDSLREAVDVSLALSLHAPTDDLRTQLVPLNKKYPIDTVLAACRRYLDGEKRRQVTMEYVMLKEVNDQPEHARALRDLLKGIQAKVNLIPFNPFPGTIYERSDPQAILRFQTCLREGGMMAFIRKTRGDAISAACGQLAGEVQDRTRRSQRVPLQWRKSCQTPSYS